MNVGVDSVGLMAASFRRYFMDSCLTVPIYDSLYIAGAITILKKSSFDFNLTFDFLLILQGWEIEIARLTSELITDCFCTGW